MLGNNPGLHGRNPGFSKSRIVQLKLDFSCEHVLESKKATESVAREKPYIRGTRAVSKLVFLLHVGALVSALPSSAPRKSGV